MKTIPKKICRRLAVIAVGAASVGPLISSANPSGGVVGSGTATFNPAGSQLTVQTSDRALIHWQSFNIGGGETTTFVQPSSSSVVWNQISDGNPSQILGTLNANGYVVLQNQNGFYVGGTAAITAHGLLMTTAPIAAPDLSSGGAWSFNAPPPAAQIVNYGQINVGNGGSAFLIANHIQNNGNISAPGGAIGLYAGQQVLVSTRPDGRGLSARVTLPSGSVDNHGQLIADAGTIALHAQVVNQGGMIQANSIRNVNGAIELVASESLNLAANSVITASGDAGGNSPGGFVALKSDGAYADNPTSKINVAGGVGGGAEGFVEIFGKGATPNTIQSAIDGFTGPQYVSAKNHLLVNPFDLTLSTAASDPAAANPNLNMGDLSAYSQINLYAAGNITIGSAWALIDPGAAAMLALSAGNNILLNNNSSLNAGRNWNVSLSAGPRGLSGTPAADTDSIYLNGNSFLQAQNGSIRLWAANDVKIATGSSATVANNGIRTIGIQDPASGTRINGGSIEVTAEFGSVNTGGNGQGFVTTGSRGYRSTAPYYSAAQTVGGISTMAGGNVTITAGGDVGSYIANGATGPSAAADGGSGAFGASPGNVTITAGGSVYGHFVVANGIGAIAAGLNPQAADRNIGSADSSDLTHLFALSLIKGSWTVSAPNGNIYLQEVRNPNGVFNESGGVGSGGNHLFDYDAASSVSLDAPQGGVFITGQNLPRPGQTAVPMIFPPSLEILAGAGGVNLANTLVLFPSALGNLHITTTDLGNFLVDPSSASQLIMSESNYRQWLGGDPAIGGVFGYLDAGLNQNSLQQYDNPDPVTVNIAGRIENLVLYTPKQTRILVGGDLINSSFSGQNLHATDLTSVHVGGQMFNRSPYTFSYLTAPLQSLPVTDLPAGVGASWNSIFNLAVDPSKLTDSFYASLKGADPSAWFNLALKQAGAFNGVGSPNFLYNAATLRLGYNGTMDSSVAGILSQSLTVLRLVNGVPQMANGKFVFDTVNWADPNVIADLYRNSHDPLFGAHYDPAIDPNHLPGVGAPSTSQDAGVGYGIGGPGQFDVSAGSLLLGNSRGILSYGVQNNQGRADYQNLASITRSGANLNVSVSDELNMLTSTIASLGGGDVNVSAGSLDLGSVELAARNTSGSAPLAYGIYTASHGDVNVVATKGDVNIAGSRIAAYDGGNISVSSLLGNVNAGSGGAVQASVFNNYVDPDTGLAVSSLAYIYGSGILAACYHNSAEIPGAASLPGNITVTTPRGNIVSSQGGILQEALNGNTAAGPTITLTAGTLPSDSSPGYTGNIDLGNSGVVGGTVNLRANGNISGLIISRQDSSVNASASFSGTVLSGGTANLSAGGSVSGTVIGVTGANVSGGNGISATVLSQNANVGGQSENTLGAAANASSASQSASQQAASDTKQVASNDVSDDDEKKKKTGKTPELMRRVGRVTVILPKVL